MIAPSFLTSSACLVVEGCEHVDRIDVGPQDLLAESNLKVTVLTLNVGVVLPLAEDVEPPRRGSPREDVRGGINPTSLSTSDHPGEVVSLQIRTALKGEFFCIRVWFI